MSTSADDTTDTTTVADPARGQPPAGNRAAPSARAALFLAGVLALQLGFILSYIGAFHSPSPHRIPVALVAPAALSAQLADRLDHLPGDPIHTTAAVDESAARTLVLERGVDAAFIVGPRGNTDTLLVASAAGPALTQVATDLARKIEAGEHRTVTVTDIRPPTPATDAPCPPSTW